MDIGREIRTITVTPAETPVPNRRTAPAKPDTAPTRRPAVPPRKAPDTPTKAPEKDPVKT